MGNGIQTATLLLAAMYSGLIANPLNLLCQPSQVRYIVEHSDTRAIFVSEESRAAITAAITALRDEGFDREILVVTTEPDALLVPVFAPSELALAMLQRSLQRALLHRRWLPSVSVRRVRKTSRC